jgi:hypothetical protein
VIAWQAATAASPAARRHSALALEYGRSRDSLDADLLRGCGDPGADSATSADQYLQQLANTLRLLDSPDTSFMLGQQLLPGHDGAPATRWRRRPTCARCYRPCAASMPA